MYIGGVDAKGLHHLVWEIVDNAVDEYLNGYADPITVTLHKSGDAVTVTDNGRGIPVDMHPKYKKTGLELVLTALHAGGKFGETTAATSTPAACTASARRSSTRCRRSSSPPSSATASSTSRTTRRACRRAKVEKVGPFRGHGTAIYFEPDDTIFKTTRFDADTIKARLEDMSYIHSGLHDHLQERGHRRRRSTSRTPAACPSSWRSS